ncbi:MAG: NAD(P)-dependent oxidoreductase [Clostridiales Family XIII bacterium]|jgi:nucleoside-diphosphate-sugar epimerase|nr:NAD(P)-dependent oxidoreductase [Clostridiales Family XIII bacterium]
MRILITGGYGFIGMYATAMLTERGHDVYIFDTLPAPPAGMEGYFAGTTAIRGDLLNPLFLIEAISKNRIERILHLAALRNNDSRRFPHAAFKLNCEGAVNCLEAARISGVERLCYASSVAVLGSFGFFESLGLGDKPLSEDAPCRPSNVYGVTKYFCETMGDNYSKLYGLSVIGVRLPIIFGAGKKGGSRSSHYNEMIEKAAAGEPVSARAVKAERFNIQYVKDSAKALVCGCLAAPGKTGVYNCGGTIVTMADYVRAIKNVFPGADISLIEDPAASILDNTCIDSGLAAKELGFEPSFTPEQGIRDHMDSLI